MQPHLCEPIRTLAILYDIHGNLPALEAVLADAERAGTDAFVLGGDVAAFGPWPGETVARLNELPNASWIRGNGERWLREPPPFDPAKMPAPMSIPLEHALGRLRGADADRLYALPESVELDGVLYVHGSPLADDRSFSPEPGEEDEQLLAGVRYRTVVFGHSHLQFRREGPNGSTLVNPGSVGMPLDGDARAAWAIRGPGGEFEFRRTDYDVERAARGALAIGPGWGEAIAARIRRGSD